MKKLRYDFSPRGLFISEINEDELDVKEVCSDEEKVRRVAKKVFGSRRFV